jgi:hypothetical protein
MFTFSTLSRHPVIQSSRPIDGPWSNPFLAGCAHHGYEVAVVEDAEKFAEDGIG